jgi:hypothetical protein
LNLHTKLEEYILASFQSNFYTLSSLAIKNWEPYADSLGRIRVNPLTPGIYIAI